MSGDHGGSVRTDCAPDYPRTRMKGGIDGTHLDLSHSGTASGRLAPFPARPRSVRLRHRRPGRPRGKRKGHNPSVASIYRALAEHAKREAFPEAVDAAHADFAALQSGELPGPRTATAQAAR
ncbi:hypothetical protein [Streptomyces sp. NRRL S-146]|uniref:hypothetical protein n=1 Tax=Streptomyces sp. NRRL S-146 TaxID=1463884 RepID=UPI0004C9CCD0|nr:hypothetical protein [Streptomyces sp. NRRL S-146]